MNTEKSKNFEEWLENAKKDENFAYLFERIGELIERTKTLLVELEKVKNDRSFLLQLFHMHSHSKDGKTLLPSEVVKFND